MLYNYIIQLYFTLSCLFIKQQTRVICSILGDFMKKQPQITEKTKNIFLNSFWQLYKKDGMKKITVQNICDYSKYDRTTFYRYYNNVDHITKELEDYIINTISSKIVKTEIKKTNSYIMFNNFKKFSNNYGEYIVVFYNNNNYSFYNKLKKLIKNDVYSYFNINITNEDMKEFFFEFVFSSLISSYVYWYENKNVISDKTFVKFANNIITAGINSILKIQ